MWLFSLNLAPAEVSQWFPFVAHIALAMVGFLLGEKFVGKDLKEKGKVVLWVTVGETLLAAGFVLAALLAIGSPLALALLLAGIAPASAPAAILEIVREGKAKGFLTDTVLGVVAIDDAWGIILFSLLCLLLHMWLRAVQAMPWSFSAACGRYPELFCSASSWGCPWHG